MIYVPSVHDNKHWFVIEVTPRARSILDNVEVDTMEDNTITNDETNTLEDIQEIDVIDNLTHASNLEDEHVDDEDEQLGDEDEQIENPVECDSIGLFIDLEELGLELDHDACKDLTEDDHAIE